MAFKAKMVKTFNKAKFFTKAHSPEILLGVGIVAGVGAVVTACFATAKTIPEVQETKKQMEDLDNSEGVDIFFEYQNNRRQEKGLEPIEVTDAAIAKEKKKLTRHIVGTCAKNYAPTVGLMVLSTTAILTSYRIIDGRLLKATIAYEGLNASYQRLKQYREVNIERNGADEDRAIWDSIDGATTHKETKTKTNEETGEEEEYEEIVPNEEKDMPWHSIYSVEYKNSSYQPGLDYERLRTVQNWANDRLINRGYVFLNEVYEALDIPQNGNFVGIGWLSPDYMKGGDPGDGYIDFGVFGNDLSKLGPDVVAWRNGEVDHVVLDFNVDGPIYKRINAINKLVEQDMDLWHADRAAFYRNRSQPKHV